MWPDGAAPVGAVGRAPGPEPARPPPSDRGGWPPGFGQGDTNRRALLVLASLRGITPRRLLEIAQREGSASACLDRIRAGVAGSPADREAARRIDPDEVRNGLASRGARMVTPDGDEYPGSLEDLADPPAALFVRGASLAELVPRVAVVGARNCTLTGREVARALGRGLASVGVCVVSGAARGIDTEGHVGALAVGGPTVAVLGCGIDRPYPLRNGALLERIAARGAVVSEYPPGVPAEAFRFPARNRIVAGLSRAVVVVEGAAGSGSLITADHALDLGRTVFAVPGPVTSPLAEAPLGLIREGAVLIRGPDDLLADLGWTVPEAERIGADAPPGTGPVGRGGHLTDLERAVMGALAGPTLPEHVALAVGRRVPDVVPVLLGLELRGLVRSVGGRYERRFG